MIEQELIDWRRWRKVAKILAVLYRHHVPPNVALDPAVLDAASRIANVGTPSEATLRILREQLLRQSDNGADDWPPTTATIRLVE